MIIIHVSPAASLPAVSSSVQQIVLRTWVHQLGYRSAAACCLSCLVTRPNARIMFTVMVLLNESFLQLPRILLAVVSETTVNGSLFLPTLLFLLRCYGLHAYRSQCISQDTAVFGRANVGALLSDRSNDNKLAACRMVFFLVGIGVVVTKLIVLFVKGRCSWFWSVVLKSCCDVQVRHLCAAQRRCFPFRHHSCAVPTASGRHLVTAARRTPPGGVVRRRRFEIQPGMHLRCCVLQRPIGQRGTKRQTNG